jgi:hypothetical protein
MPADDRRLPGHPAADSEERQLGTLPAAQRLLNSSCCPRTRYGTFGAVARGSFRPGNVWNVSPAATPLLTSNALEEGDVRVGAGVAQHVAREVEVEVPALDDAATGGDVDPERVVLADPVVRDGEGLKLLSPKCVVEIPEPSSEPEFATAATPMSLLLTVAVNEPARAALSRLLLIVSEAVCESRKSLLSMFIVVAARAPAVSVTPPPPVAIDGWTLVRVLSVNTRSPPACRRLSNGTGRPPRSSQCCR